MRTIVYGTLFACLLAGRLGAQADAQADARAIVDKAIKATGGEEKLARMKAGVSKSKGMFHGFGQPFEYTAEGSTQPPEQNVSKIEADIMGMRFSIMHVINGDKGWIKAMDQTRELPKEALDEEREQLYAQWVARLVALKDPAFKLGPLGEVQLGGRTLVGVQVTRKDRRDVNLFFDKETGLLRKMETRVKEQQGAGPEVAQETLFDNYKEFDGIRGPTKLVIKRDGKDYVEAEVLEYKPVEKLDDAIFGQP
jgi:hypothetical protein